MSRGYHPPVSDNCKAAVKLPFIPAETEHFQLLVSNILDILVNLSSTHITADVVLLSIVMIDLSQSLEFPALEVPAGEVSVGLSVLPLYFLEKYFKLRSQGDD